MGRLLPMGLVLLAFGCSSSKSPSGTGGRASVLQHHNDLARDGLYIDPALTQAAVMGTAGTSGGGLQLDATFANANVAGYVYAQPLYLAGTGANPDLVIVATEMNNVYAFDATTGAQVWTKSTETLGTPASNLGSGAGGDLPCGGITPSLGITGTPVIDETTRTIYLDAMAVDTSSGSRVVEHRVHALDATTGNERSGWPVNLNSTASSDGTAFDSTLQNQRGAMTLLGAKVFIPFGGHEGDCGGYHGWVVGITTTGKPAVSAWATRAIAGGIWGSSGIASDGTSLFFATGNSKSSAAAAGNTSSGDSNGSWGDSEAVFKLPTSPPPPAMATTTDYFVAGNWVALDDVDADLGGTSPILVKAPGATPSNLVVAMGKDHYAYLLDRANLGGMDAAPLAKVAASTSVIIDAAASYTTSKGTYLVFKGVGATCPNGQTGGLTALKIAAANPPTLSVAWCGGPGTSYSPAVSQTDGGGANTIVWSVGNDEKLHGVDGDSGVSVFDGGPTAMSAVTSIQAPIVANGRIFVASNTQIYAFKPVSN